MKPKHIWFIIGNDFWAMGAKIDKTLLLKPLYILWFPIGAQFNSLVGFLMVMSAILSVEIMQGFQYKWDKNNFFGVFDILVVITLNVGFYFIWEILWLTR